LIGIIIGVLIWLLVQSLGQDFAVYFMDVGHGDAILITTPNRRLILIDGGPDSSVLHELGRVAGSFTSEIDLVIATHLHADHIGGLLDVLAQYKVNNVIVNPKQYYSPLSEAFLKQLKENNIRLNQMALGETFTLDGVIVSCIWPNREAVLSDDINNSSYMFLVEYEGFRVLLTSDAEFAGEYSADMLEALMKVGDIDVLKVPHQGSMNSLSSEALDIIRPEVSVLSVGKNSYGHPHKQAITSLLENNSKVITTEKHGTIKINMSESELYIKTYK
jgi:competence protein ComEC